MKMITINNIEDMKKFYDKKTDTFRFNESVKFTFDLIINSNIFVPGNMQAKNIEIKNLNAYDVNAWNLHAKNIMVDNVDAWGLFVEEDEFVVRDVVIKGENENWCRQTY